MLYTFQIGVIQVSLYDGMFLHYDQTIIIIIIIIINNVILCH